MIAPARRDDRGKQVLTFVLGLLDDMVREGTLEGGSATLTEAGRAEYAALQAAGFSPSREEVSWAMTYLNDPEFMAETFGGADE